MSERRCERILVWFRRDLRAHDHAALYHALKDSRAVHCAFVFDTELLQSLPRYDRRVEFIWDSITELRVALRRLGGGSVSCTAACATKCRDWRLRFMSKRSTPTTTTSRMQ
jgi:deoxyribodipyrimidine photo-lyase